jgi:hypothetical protein
MRPRQRAGRQRDPHLEIDIVDSAHFSAARCSFPASFGSAKVIYICLLRYSEQTRSGLCRLDEGEIIQ